MTAPYARCGCGQDIASEAAAQRHAKVCGKSGSPRGWRPERVWVDGHWSDEESS